MPVVVLGSFLVTMALLLLTLLGVAMGGGTGLHGDRWRHHPPLHLQHPLPRAQPDVSVGAPSVRV